MKKKLAPLVAIALAMVFGGDAAHAADRMESRPIVGVIVGIDRAAHAITVVEQFTGSKIRLVIPRGQRVTIAPTVSFGSSVEFERLMIGLQYRGVTVQ